MHLRDKLNCAWWEKLPAGQELHLGLEYILQSPYNDSRIDQRATDEPNKLDYKDFNQNYKKYLCMYDEVVLKSFVSLLISKYNYFKIHNYLKLQYMCITEFAYSKRNNLIGSTCTKY